MMGIQSLSAQKDNRGRRSPQRTCVGCSAGDARGRLLRLVLTEDGPSFDLTGAKPGRGAHVHGRRGCLSVAASRGLSKSFRRRVDTDLQSLLARLQSESEQRLGCLLTSAAKSGQLVIGQVAVEQAIARQSEVTVLVACDAPVQSMGTALSELIKQGRAVAWGTMHRLGALVAREQIAILGVRETRMGQNIAEICRIVDSARSGAEVR